MKSKKAICSFVLIGYIILLLIGCNKKKEDNNVVTNSDSITFIHNATPGELYSTLSSDIMSRTTDLTIIGTIDARDFAVMRDKMPFLKRLDLTNITVSEYKGALGPIGPFNILYSANEIPNGAFAFRHDLVSIKLSSTITSIGDYVFNSCGVKTITISSSIKNIGENAFVDCKTMITVENENLIYSSADGVLFDKSQDTLIHFPSIKTGNYIIPSSVNFIKTNAFHNCSQLVSLTISSSVNVIDHNAFGGCNGLTTIINSSNLKTIGSDAFWGCDKLNSITIPKTVTFIGSNAFAHCKSLKSIDSNTPIPIDLSNSNSVFLDINDTTCILNVPLGSKSLYENANQWKTFKNIIEN